MIEIIGLVASIVIPAVGAVVWLVRIEGRVNVLQAQQAATEKRVDGLEEQILERLTRIESMLLQRQ